MKMLGSGGAIDDLPDGKVADPDVPAVPAGELLAAVRVAIPQSPVPASYAVGLALLAGCLVLMPLAYLGLLCFLGWLAVWHAIETFASLQYGPYFVFHIPMAVLGSVLTLFLVKPVFFRSRKTDGDFVVLSPGAEPTLFQAIHQLCDSIGAARPARIEVDCEANAHARHAGAIDSLTGKQLILRIGLPLAASMSVRQFLGVIAHELGHFNQKRGMTTSYLVRRLTHFFIRVVFQRDRIDLMLARMKARRRPIGRATYFLVAAFVEPMRGLLWAMAMAGQLLSCGVLRRMEHDADGVDGHVSGVVDFARTSRLLLFLDFASRRARSDLSDALSRGRLADDLPRLVVGHARSLFEHRDDLLKILDDGKTKWFDTHPTHHDRIAYVERVTPPTAGLADITTAPAAELFADFGAICRQSTSAHYADVLGKKRLDGVKLVPVDELAGDQAGRRADVRSLVRYVRGLLIGSRPIFPGRDVTEPVTDVPAAIEALSTARRDMLAAAESAGSAAVAIRSADAELPEFRAQLEFVSLYPNNPRAEALRGKAADGARRHVATQADSVASMVVFEKFARDRMTIGLRLLAGDAMIGRIPDEELAEARRDVGRYLPVVRAVESCQSTVQTLTERLPVVNLLARYLSSNPTARMQNRSLIPTLMRSTKSVVSALGQVIDHTRPIEFPFAHATVGISASAVIVPTLPDSQKLRDSYEAGLLAVDRTRDLGFRSLAVLTRWAERVESAIGLDPLPEPVEPPKPAKNQASIKREAGQASRRSMSHWSAYGGRAVAGLVMVTVLVYFSIDPPSLPAMPWESPGDRDNRYQPAAFHVVYLSPPPRPTGPNGPAAQGFGGYQGRAVVVQPGGVQRVMPPGYVPPAYHAPSFPSSPSSPGSRSPGGMPGSNAPQPGFNRGGGGGGGSRGGGGGGHR